MIVVGLDIGVRCGFCIGRDGTPIESGTWLLKRPGDPAPVAFGNLLEALCRLLAVSAPWGWWSSKLPALLYL